MPVPTHRFCGRGKKGGVEIIGHRGSAVENTRDPLKPIGNTANAISKGIGDKVDWIEIDIRQSKDGVLILFHDGTIQSKTTVGKGKVAELSINELRSLDLFTDPPEKILTLAEFENSFIQRLKDTGTGLILDIKVPGLKTPVLEWLDGAGLDLDRVIIFADYGILKDYKSSGYQLGYTFTWGKPNNRLLYLFQKNEIIRRLQELDARILVLPVIFTSRQLIQMAEDEGFTVWTYGSDDKRDLEMVRGLGAKGLIVDHTEKAVQAR